MKFRRSILTAIFIAAALPVLQGCFTVAAGGVAVGALAVADRRSIGTQTEDETIEWKASSRVSDEIKDKIHVNYTSYNRRVLISGEAPDEATKQRIGEIVGKIENVQGAWNELAIAPVSSLSGRSNDSFITSKVKARFVDANQFYANHVKVVTEARTAFLMGIVNEREAKAAVQVARTTDGVRKVVNLLEVVPEADTKRIDNAVKGDDKKGAAGGAEQKTTPFETSSPAHGAK